MSAKKKSAFAVLTIAGFLFFQSGLLAAPQTMGKFFAALQEHDTNAAWNILENNTNLAHSTYGMRKWPLLEAAADGDVSIVKRLLKLGADVNAIGDTMMSVNARMTALDEAAKNGHENICKLLLEAGADPNLRGFSGENALHFTFNPMRGDDTNQVEIAKMLLDYGANPFFEAGYYKTTPFELAITRSDGTLIPTMLDTSRSIKTARKHARRNYVSSVKRQTSQFLAVHGAAMLTAAARRGELQAVKALIKAGMSPKTNVQNDYPVLQVFALSEASAEKLKNFSCERWMLIRDLLIKNGADYDAFAATALGDITRAKQLVAADKSVAQSKDRDGETPLHWAVKTDRLPLTKFWIENGVPLAATNSAGETALHLAAEKGLVEPLKMLLAAHAPTSVRDTNGWTPIDAAIHAKQPEAIHLLLKSSPSHPERGMIITIHQAAENGDLDALAALLGTTTNLEARNGLGLTPLQLAVLHGHLAAAAMLVDKGANVNARDPAGNTLLHQILLQDQVVFIRDRPPTNWLARVGKDPDKKLYVEYLTVGKYEQGPNPLLQAASFLLACGIDATATNNVGETAMQLVADNKTGRGIFFFDDERAKLLQLLAGHGGNVNERDANGNTALHRAVFGYNTVYGGKISDLIAAGADVNATNNEGQTPLHVAVKEIVEWPDEGGTDNAILELIKAKANVNAQDVDGMTPLHILAASGGLFKTQAVKALLAAGADPNLRDKSGRTPVHAFLAGEWPWDDAVDCIKMLAKAGANLSAKDDDGKTPLHYLAACGKMNPMFFMHGIGDVFEKAGVNVNAHDNDGDTPLHIAARKRTKDVFDWLVQHGADLDATNNAGETPRLLAMRAWSGGGFPMSKNSNDQINIFQAVRDNNLAAVAALLKADPSLVNSTNQQGALLSLSLTFRGGNTNMAAFLLRHGARWDPASAIIAGRVDIITNLLAQEPALATNQQFFRLIAEKGDGDMARAFLEAGANVSIRFPQGLSLLGIALMNHHTNVADLLIARGATQNIFDAVCLDNLATAKELISRDRSLASAMNIFGTPLTSIATARGNVEILKLLLDNGAAVNPPRCPLLCVAAAYNQKGAATLLVRRGAAVNAFARNGLTALHIAAVTGSAGVAEVLLKHKANPDERIALPLGGVAPPFFPIREGMFLRSTPLHLAALFGRTNMVALLLKSGANVNIVNGWGKTPLDMAWQIGGLQFNIPEKIPDLPPRQSFFPPSPLDRQMTTAILKRAGGQPGKNRQTMPGFNRTPSRFN